MANGKVREYVGARYVPIFADPVTWDDERAYDPLTMVQYSGETYMSKQYVPIGAPLPTVAQGQESNEFWVHMSNWNAQVEAYREEVMRYAEEVLLFDGRIDTLEADLPTSEFDSTNTVKAAIDAVNTAIGLIEDNIDSVESDIDNLEAIIPASSFSSANTVSNVIEAAKARITNLENLGDVVVLIGDSYGQGWDPDTSTSHDGWIAALTARLQNIGKTVKSAAQGGYGFATSNTFLSLLQQVVGNMTANEKIRCTKVVIAGGFNDRDASQGSIDNGINQCVQYINTNLPNAILYVSHVGYCVTGFTTGSHANATSASCVQSYLRYKQSCAYYGAKFDNGSITTLCNNSYFTSDFVHPNATGNTVIARRLFNFVLDGNQGSIDSYVTYNDWIHTGDSNKNFSYSGNGNFLYIIDANNGIPISAALAGNSALVVQFTDAVSYTFGLNNSWTLGRLKAAGIVGFSFYIPVYGVIRITPTGETQDKYIEYSGRLAINNDGEINFNTVLINSAGDNYLSGTVDRIQIKFPNISYF